MEGKEGAGGGEGYVLLRISHIIDSITVIAHMFLPFLQVHSPVNFITKQEKPENPQKKCTVCEYCCEQTGSEASIEPGVLRTTPISSMDV